VPVFIVLFVNMLSLMQIGMRTSFHNIHCYATCLTVTNANSESHLPQNCRILWMYLALTNVQF